MSAYQTDLEGLLKEPLPWEKLAGKNIIITGATGLIGSCLVDVLMMNESVGCNVYAMGRNADRAWKLFEKYSKEDMLMIGDASGLKGNTSKIDIDCANNFGIHYCDINEFTK